MTEILVEEIPIDVTKKDIINVHLAVYPPNGHVRISAPAQMNDEAIRVFAISKLQWIRRQQNKFMGQLRETPREYIYRETHYFFGKGYLLNIIENEDRPEVKFNNKTLDLYIPKNTSLASKHHIINEWYRRELKNVIPELLSKWEKIIGVKASFWGVKLMKTKWGSCNPDRKRIWLNLELAKKPTQCLEYIIVHELVHLLEENHNVNFERYMDRFMPQWRVYRDDLNNHPIGHASWKY